MQIALTKKLADVMGVKPGIANPEANPLFCWTANWTNTLSQRKEDMVVLVNNSTQFTVAIYGVKRRGFKGITSKMLNAIRNTLLSMSLNTELVDEYMKQTSDVTFVANRDRQQTAWLNRKGIDAAFVVLEALNESTEEIEYEDTLGRIVNQFIVGCRSGGVSDGYVPAQKMIEELTKLTGKPAYRYRAFELLVTLDLEIYQATRRLIVPAELDFLRFHHLLQNVFGWGNCHLYEFDFFNRGNPEPLTTLVPIKEALSYDNRAVLITNQKLSDYLPKHKQLFYTYDMGDCWTHQIELVRVIDEHNAESPYMMEAVGQTPPEDVGGIGGYVDFYHVMQDEKHPDYTQMKKWSDYWSPTLPDWKSRPRVVHV